MLIGQFWGTGAAEGIPAPFCQCETCRIAREQGGKEQRLRSCFRLTDKIMLDLGADAVVQSIKYGAINEVEHVVVTHTHDDHLNAHMLMEAMWSQAPKRYRNTLHYYLTDKAFEIIEHWRANPWILKGKLPEWEAAGYVAFHKLEFGRRTEIEGIGFTPFRGNHKGNVQEDAALYLIELPDGRKLFYGLDSADYYPETLEALKAHHIDLYITEATVGTAKREPHPSHMRLCDVRKLIGQLYDQGTLSENSTVYLSHINHSSTHQSMLQGVEELSFPVPTIVAWDGMKIL